MIAASPKNYKIGKIVLYNFSILSSCNLVILQFFNNLYFLKLKRITEIQHQRNIHSRINRKKISI